MPTRRARALPAGPLTRTLPPRPANRRRVRSSPSRIGASCRPAAPASPVLQVGARRHGPRCRRAALRRRNQTGELGGAGQAGDAAAERLLRPLALRRRLGGLASVALAASANLDALVPASRCVGNGWPGVAAWAGGRRLIRTVLRPRHDRTVHRAPRSLGATANLKPAKAGSQSHWRQWVHVTTLR